MRKAAAFRPPRLACPPSPASRGFSPPPRACLFGLSRRGPGRRGELRRHRDEGRRPDARRDSPPHRRPIAARVRPAPVRDERRARSSSAGKSGTSRRIGASGITSPSRAKKNPRDSRARLESCGMFSLVWEWLPYMEVERVARLSDQGADPGPGAPRLRRGELGAGQDWTDYLHWPYVPPSSSGQRVRVQRALRRLVSLSPRTANRSSDPGPLLPKLLRRIPRLRSFPPSSRLARLEQEEILPGLTTSSSTSSDPLATRFIV